jgi:hypothetical protein
LKKGLKIGTKPPKTSWVLFEIDTFVKNCHKTSYNILGLLLQNLKIDKKPPETSWVFFDIEKCAKNVKKNS